MEKIINFDDSQICVICRKKKAEFLCDMPTNRMQPLHLHKENGVTDYENSFKWFTVTCDNPICKECAIEVGNDIHFCIGCADRFKKIIH